MHMFRATGLLTLLLVALTPTISRAITIDWVTVGDPGNAADTINTGTNPNYGAVSYSYQIMKYEFTNAQYVAFLNAVDPEGTNPNAIYNTNMGSNVRLGGGIRYTGTNPLGAKYTPLPNFADKPVNFVSWWDAARVANWLHNGALTSGSSNASANALQNTGAYTLGTATGGPVPARNIGATYWVPLENEWYKAAYYQGGGTSSGYWAYGTQAGSAPVAVGATVVGTGSIAGVSPVTSGNYANYGFVADWNGQDGNATTVGTNGGPSAYGAFDMSGNLYEWNDLGGAAGATRGIRGGGWTDEAFNQSSSNRAALDPSTEGLIGFRLAGPSPIPEVDPAGLGSVLALVTGSLGILERRGRWR